MKHISLKIESQKSDMGKCAYNNVIIQVTLDKEVVKTLDGVIDVLNKEIDTSKGEKKFTRSMVILLNQLV